MSAPFLFPTNGGNVSTLGAYASPPGSPSEGDVHISDDGPISRLWNGSSWDDFIPGTGPITVPPAAGWTAKNSATLPSVSGGGLVVVNSTGSSPWNYRTAPTAPYVIEIMTRQEGNAVVGGFAFYETATTKGILVYIATSGLLVVERHNNLGVSYASAAFTSAARMNLAMNMGHFRLRDDNTSIYFDTSPDGVNWVLAHSELRGAFFTSAPNAIAWEPKNLGTSALYNYTVT